MLPNFENLRDGESRAEFLKFYSNLPERKDFKNLAFLLASRRFSKSGYCPTPKI